MSKTPMEIYRAAFLAFYGRECRHELNPACLNAVHAHARREALEERNKLIDDTGVFFDWGNAASVVLRNLLEAYERRVRSLCTTPEELAAKPWECAEYLEARRILVDKPNWTIRLNASPGISRRALNNEETMAITDEMVQRFLNWPLPKDFMPDCGITFDGRKSDLWNPYGRGWPVGTNLFTALQAKAMLEHVLAVTSSANVSSENAFVREFNEWYARDGSVGGLENLVEDHQSALLNASLGSGGQAPSTAAGADDAKSATISPPAAAEGHGLTCVHGVVGFCEKCVRFVIENWKDGSEDDAPGQPVINVPKVGEPLINGSRDTPETDAVLEAAERVSHLPSEVGDFMRDLERQRDEARREHAAVTKERDALKGAWDGK